MIIASFVGAHYTNKVSTVTVLLLLLCFRELECVPDVFSLIEWSNWLTPSNYMRRFDTIFYFCCMGTKPDTTQDDMEVSKVEVSNNITHSWACWHH